MAATSSLAPRALATLAVLGSLTASEPRAWGLAGSGLAAVEAVLGHTPEKEEELKEALRKAEATQRSTPGDVAANFAHAILSINHGEATATSKIRRDLLQVLLVDPGHEHAFEIWDALVPKNDELERLATGLATRTDARSLYVRAWVALRLGDGRRAAELAAQTRAADPAYTSRSYWIETTAAFEAERDGEGGELFEKTLAALDDPTAELIRMSTSYVARPQELDAYEQTLPEERAGYLRSFWRGRDPFILTEENERLGEHLRRVRDARASYPLNSNGAGYFTLLEKFKELSPDLPYYTSDGIFGYLDDRDLWIDHRGYVFIRHGEPNLSDKSFVSAKWDSGVAGTRSETWLYSQNTSAPMLFHFVERLGVSEHVLALNLAQAAARTRVEDDPKEILYETGDFQELYRRRANFHRLFISIATTRSRYEMESLLTQEAQMMGGFIKQVWLDDSSTLLDRDDRLPFAAYSASFAADDGKADLFVYYAIPEHELEIESDVMNFEARLILYSDDWLEQKAEGKHSFGYTRPPGQGKRKDDENLLVGVMKMEGIEPGNYRYAFQIRETNSGKVGVSKGREEVDYYGELFVDVSDLVIADEVAPTEEKSIFERNGVRVVPIPTRVVKRKAPVNVYYEIYDLEADATGQARYDIEYKLLKIQGEPSLAAKIFDIGMNVAGAFFPYYTFLTRAGLFGLDLLTTNAVEGLETSSEAHLAPIVGRVTHHVYRLDPAKSEKGIYQLYVTVRDKATNELDTRSLRFAITD